MAITTRQNLVDYCLRRLGHPVVEINVDDDQIEDRVDEAFQYYRDFHYDAVEKVYLKTQITPSTVTITGVNAASFTNGEVITGGTSAATAIVYGALTTSTFYVFRITGTFTAAETITGASSGTTATLSSIALGNYDNQYVTNTDIVYYSMLKTELQLINDLLTGQKPVRFNRHMNRLYIDMDWKADVNVGDYIIIEAWRTLDPDTFTDVYGDGWLKKYLTALIKLQWGSNLKKFEGVQMPGGVTLNGQIIYNEAVEELKELREEAQNTYQLPIDFFTG